MHPAYKGGSPHHEGGEWGTAGGSSSTKEAESADTLVRGIGYAAQASQGIYPRAGESMDNAIGDNFRGDDEHID